MTQRRRRRCFFLSLMIIISCVCGCTGLHEIENEPEKEVYTVHYFTAKSTDEGAVKALIKVAEMYKEEHPEFHFEVESVDDRAAYLQKLKILASSDELPEMFDSDADTFFAHLAEEGQVADIDALYAELGVTENIYENAREYQRLENGFLGLICWQANTEYFWYNKTCFEQAGIEQPPKTFDEFFEVCEALQKAEITPIAVAGGVTWPPLRYLAFMPFRKTGNQFIENAVAGKESFSSETGLEAAEFMVQVSEYFQPDWENANNAQASNMVLNGTAAMMYDGTWQAPYFVNEDKELKEHIGYFTLPICDETDVTKASDYWAHGGLGTAIRKDALDDNMRDFMKFVFEHYADVSLYEFDTLPSMEVSSKDSMSEFYKELTDNYMNVKTYGYCWDVRIDSASNEVLGIETMNLALGNISPREWARRMDEAIAENVLK